jgi:hypothetical protein
VAISVPDGPGSLTWTPGSTNVVVSPLYLLVLLAMSFDGLSVFAKYEQVEAAGAEHNEGR